MEKFRIGDPGESSRVTYLYLLAFTITSLVTIFRLKIVKFFVVDPVPFKGLVALCHSFCVFYFSVTIHIHSYNHSLITFAEVCLTASQHTTIWATLHPDLSHAAPFLSLDPEWKNQDPVSGINIPDLQHRIYYKIPIKWCPVEKISL